VKGIMPHSSFYSGLDQVSEQPIKNQRNSHGFPSSLQDSPYLSSPIRPIPSSSRSQSRGGGNSNMSVTSKLSKRYTSSNSRATSPAHSTVGSLRLASPYSESIFSIHSLCTSSTQNVESERQSLSRTVMLPHEIDDLTKLFKIDNGNIEILKKAKEEGGDEDQYSISDFDDDSTIASNLANSINDDIVFEKMQEKTLGDDNILLYHRNHVMPKEVCIMKEEHDKNQYDSTEKCSPALKLPSVSTEDANKEYRKEGTNASVKKVKLKQQQESHKYSDVALLRSPYAINQTNSKRVSRKKKKS